MSSTARKAPPHAPHDHSLARDAVGLPQVIFVSVSTMAPAAGAVFAVTVGAFFAGGALPLSVLIALAGCLFTALSIGQLARHLPSAGGMYTYISRGLGGYVGFLAGWGFNLAYLLVVPLLSVLFGDLLGSTLQQHLGYSFDTWWVVGGVFVCAAVFLSNYLGIQTSTRLGLLLGGLEFAVMIALSLTLILHAGTHNTLNVFTTHFSDVKGFAGTSGVIAGSIYAVLAFIGFDAAAPLAEETRDPRRTVGRAVVGATILVGVFYVFVTYAAAVYFGPGRFSAFPTAGSGNPWNLMASAVWGGGWVLLFLALLNSSMASANGGGSAASRVLWSMGRIRCLPSVLGRTHPRWRSPHLAIILVFVFSLGITLWLGEQYTPIVSYSLIGTIITAAILPIYILVNVACIAYFVREQRQEFSLIKHILFPVLGVVLFVPGFFTALGITVFKFVTPLSHPINLAGPVVAIWYVIGLAVAVYFAIRHPERIRNTARVFTDDLEAADDAAPAVPPLAAQPGPQRSAEPGDMASLE
jgi:amino acid transporter